MYMISVKQLRYFQAVAQFGHFGRAASHCAVTQPALSMQIKELEAELGIQLLERRRQGVTLTEPGREIARRAGQVLTAIRDLNDFARCCGSPLSGALHLGVIPSLAPYLLPPLLPNLRRQYPQLKLVLSEELTETLLRRLRGHEIDAALLATPVEEPDLTALPLFDEPFWLAHPRGHALYDKD